MDDITAEEFEKYEKLRASRKSNMFLIKEISELTGLWWMIVVAIQEQYDDLCKKYPEVVEKCRK